MEARYAESDYLTESLANCLDLDDGRLSVVDADARIVALDRETMEERNLFTITENLFTLGWESSPGGLKLELLFHEDLLSTDFTLSPAGIGAIDPVQGTQPCDLSETLSDVFSDVEEALDIHRWDFVKVDGASIAHGGYITDFEFTYETFVGADTLRRAVE